MAPSLEEQKEKLMVWEEVLEPRRKEQKILVQDEMARRAEERDSDQDVGVDDSICNGQLVHRNHGGNSERVETGSPRRDGIQSRDSNASIATCVSFNPSP
ncbi:hypothetical protein N7G274_000073 [Stereocaulon virgatum]|uniref:Uncharacterized protein n=1 Tax=Stereocaulon virgatum TaxID=373712 RepID=A0ABR4AR22_9LECA